MYLATACIIYTEYMQGDITRYGERKLAGMMKDGYNSAQRYYMNIFRDTYRQVLIGKHMHSDTYACMYTVRTSTLYMYMHNYNYACSVYMIMWVCAYRTEWLIKYTELLQSLLTYYYSILSSCVLTYMSYAV